MIKHNLTSKMDVLDEYTNDLTSKINCIPNFYLDENDLFSTIINKSYLNRINYNKYFMNNEKNMKTNSRLPKCTGFLDLEFSMFSFEHLKVRLYLI